MLSKLASHFFTIPLSLSNIGQLLFKPRCISSTACLHLFLITNLHIKNYSRNFQITTNFVLLAVFVIPTFVPTPIQSNILDPKAVYFLATRNSHNSYICLDRTSSQIYVSHHVIFCEHIFSFQSATATHPHNISTPLLFGTHYNQYPLLLQILKPILISCT